jgi:hypothetical protein
MYCVSDEAQAQAMRKIMDAAIRHQKLVMYQEYSHFKTLNEVQNDFGNHRFGRRENRNG